jgi:hypothetical protein
MPVQAAAASDILQETPSDLTPAKITTLIAFATVVWFLAALFIRFVGPSGVFGGIKGGLLYLATIPATIPLNARTRKIVGLSKVDTLTAVAVTSATATMLDGVAMTWFPALYGGDPAIVKGGAAWLLWAIGVGLALALVTTIRSERAR